MTMAMMAYREVVKILKLNGWYYVRTNGSHETWKHPSGKTCPVKCTAKDIPSGTVAKISNITGIKF